MMNIQLFAPAVMKFATDKRNNFKLELSWGIDKQILPQLFYLYYCIAAILETRTSICRIRSSRLRLYYVQIFTAVGIYIFCSAR